MSYVFPRRVVSSATSITVQAASGVPYAVPTVPGTSRAITFTGENFPVNVMPGWRTAGMFYYGAFGNYGGGCYNPQYSAHGAWVIAGAGGHNGGPMWGALAFDFTSGLWVYHMPSPGEPQIDRDIIHPGPEMTAYGEVSQVAFPNIGPEFPAPAHLESSNVTVPGSPGKGIVLRVMGYAGGSSGQAGSNSVHAFNLNTNVWSRPSGTSLPPDYSWGNYQCVLDPVSMKVYRPKDDLYHYPSPMQYYNINTNLHGGVGVNAPNGQYGGDYRGAFLEPTHRLLVSFGESVALGFKMYAYQMDNTGVLEGLFQPTALTLAPGSDTFGVLKGVSAYNPDDGCHYFMNNSPADLYRLKPPASNPLVNEWQLTKLTITPADGKPLPTINPDALAQNSQHCTRLMWVDALGCLAWIPGNYKFGYTGDNNRVYLIKPPVVT